MAAEAVWSGEQTVFGNKRMAIGTLTMSGLVSGAAQVMGTIYGGVAVLASGIGNNSASVHYNVNSAGSSVNGYLQIKSAVAGDVFNVMVWGT